VKISDHRMWADTAKGEERICKGKTVSELSEVYYSFVYLGLKWYPRLWILPVFEFFLVILKPPRCLLLVSMTLRQLEVFRLLTSCAKTAISLGNRLLHRIGISSNLWPFSGQFVYVFSGLGVLSHYEVHIVYFSCCCLTVFVLSVWCFVFVYLRCFCSGFIIGTCAAETARQQ
jgi:hypothetical protein